MFEAFRASCQMYLDILLLARGADKRKSRAKLHYPSYHIANLIHQCTIPGDIWASSSGWAWRRNCPRYSTLPSFEASRAPAERLVSRRDSGHGNMLSVRHD